MSSYPKVSTCPMCNGSGRVPVRRLDSCPDCDGTGVVPRPGQALPCETCAGTGRVATDTTRECDKCSGRGGRMVHSAADELLFTGIDPVTGKTQAQLYAEQDVQLRERLAADARRSEAAKAHKEKEEQYASSMWASRALIIVAVGLGLLLYLAYRIFGFLSVRTIAYIAGALVILGLVGLVVNWVRHELGR